MRLALLSVLAIPLAVGCIHGGGEYKPEEGLEGTEAEDCTEATMEGATCIFPEAGGGDGRG